MRYPTPFVSIRMSHRCTVHLSRLWLKRVGIECAIDSGHGEGEGWPLSLSKEGEFTKFVGLLKVVGVTTLTDRGPWSVATLRAKIFGK